MTHQIAVRNDDPAMKGMRARTKQGTLRRVREDKTAKHIEQQYGITLPGRSDKQLRTLKKEMGVRSQKELLKKVQK
jgi:hypothetical protein